MSANDRPIMEHDLTACHRCGDGAVGWEDGPMGVAVGVCAKHRSPEVLVRVAAPEARCSEAMAKLVEAYEAAVIGEERSSRNASMSRDYPPAWRAEHRDAHEKATSGLITAIATLESALADARATVTAQGRAVEAALAVADRAVGSLHREGVLSAMREVGNVAATLRGVLAAAPALTVGAALADPRVQAGTHVVEYNDEGAWRAWRQLRSGKRESLSTRAFIQGFRGSPPERTMAWLAWMSTSVDNLDGAEVWTEEYARPCRLVPLADADRDPAERGPL